MRAPVACLVVLVLLPGHAWAAPAREAELSWVWTLAPDPARGVVRVTLDIAGAAGIVTRFTFLEGASPVGNVTPGPGTILTPNALRGGFDVDVDGRESFSYDADPRRAAFRPGEELAHVGLDFALFKAESVALAYTYQFYEGYTLRNRTTVRLVAPEGWGAAAPWAREGDGFALGPDEVVPRGFVAFGEFRERIERDVAGVRVEYARLGAQASFEPDLFSYLERATPYLRAVYGPSAAPRVLVVNAPDPMLRGGLGGVASLFVHEDADLRTLAHEYVHTHQRFGTEERAGASAIWLSEGDADLHGALSLLAADAWSPRLVEEFFAEAERDRFDPVVRDAPLWDATHGSTWEGRSLERFAYHKGLVVLRALDAEILAATSGRAGLPDLLRALNAAHGDPTGAGAGVAVTNEEVARVADELAGRDLSAFFARYVQGGEWPDAPRFVPAGDIEVRALRLDPPRAQPGTLVSVAIDVTNRGTRPVARDLSVLVDGVEQIVVPASLAVGQSLTLRAEVTAGPPGDHVVAVLHERATLRSLTPAAPAIARVTLVPTKPVEGGSFDVLVFVENRGETDTAVRVGARLADGGEAVSPPLDVAGLATVALTLPLVAGEPGNVTVEVRLIGSAEVVTQGVEVRPRERASSGPGVALVLLGLALSALPRARRR